MAKHKSIFKYMAKVKKQKSKFKVGDEVWIVGQNYKHKGIIKKVYKFAYSVFVCVAI